MRRRLTKEERARQYSNGVIKHLSKLKEYPAGLIAVPYMRESTYRQRKGGNLKCRESALRRHLLRRGIECCKRTYMEVTAGNSLKDRRMLRRAIKRAQWLQKQRPDRLVVIVTDTRNRFLRGRHYNGQAETDTPHVDQLKDLEKMAGNITLATVKDPKASHAEVHRHETKLGEKSKGRCGRPKKIPAGQKKERREKLSPVARRLKKNGRSLRQIARELKVAHSTIADWLK